ncbi:hypothetical protein ACYUAC_002639 [Citrobacter amalonaticus]|uniref:hypothetical protein n=1 Tax=Citrobacter amalonaticus TaxID=35703 RepID=UPI0040411332
MMLVRLTLHHLVHPRLAAGDVEITVVREALLAHQGTAAARPGGMAYLVVRRHAVDHRPAQRVRYHRQIVGFVIQPLALQVLVPGLWLCLAPGPLCGQPPRLRVARLLVKTGFASSGCLLATQVVLKGQRRVVCYLP